MAVYTSSTDQVLLALLGQLRSETPRVSEAALARAMARFQQATGVVLYGFAANDSEATVGAGLEADLRHLKERGLITRSPNPHATITLLSLPIAMALRLTKPLERLVDFVREEVRRTDDLKQPRSTL